jgi:hypothetical protein
MADILELGGITNTTIYEQADGTIFVEDKQDVQGILDRNQRKRDHRFSGWSPEGTVCEQFDIPMVVIQQFQKECGHKIFSPEFDDYMNAKLRLPEFAYLISAPAVRDAHIVIKGNR